MQNYGMRLAEHLDRHKIKPNDFQAWALRFREVVVDMRAVRARRLHEYVFEFSPCHAGSLPCWIVAMLEEALST